MTRRELVGAAALLGAGAGALSGAGTAAADAPQSTTDLLTDVLRAELLLAFAYRQALRSSALSSASRSLLERVVAQEAAHIRALTAALSKRGGRPPAQPVDVVSADRALATHHVSIQIAKVRDEAGWFRLLVDLEHVVEGAYYIAIGKLSDPALLRLASQILANEAQHELLLVRQHHPGDIKQIVPSSLVQGTK